MSDVRTTLREVADEPIAQTGPRDEFVYVDIGSVDRERKIVAEVKTLAQSNAPSRAKQILQADDVLVSMTRPNLNAVARIPPALDGAIGSTGFHVLRSQWMEPGFLYYLVQSGDFVDAMCGVVQGALYPAVRSVDIGKFEFRLPPRAEQTRIVEKLEELLADLDAGVAELKAAQRKLARYRQSLLKAAVEGRLTAQWREQHGPPQETGAELLQRILQERRARWEQKQRDQFAAQGKTPPTGWQAKYKEPAAPDTSDLPALPEGWVWASVDQVTLEQRYGSSAKTNSDSTGVPVLRMGNIQDGKLDFSSLKYLPVEHEEFPILHLEDGDMLFNRTNSPELVGKSAVYRSQISPCSYASYLISVRFAKLFSPEIAAAFINSRHGRNWVKSVVVQQVGQANVNGTKLAALAIPLAPFEEQAAIVEALEIALASVSEQESALEFGLRQAAAQRKNLLKAAFSGQLVPQDPDDEPANVLLERIRAARAQGAPTRGRRRAGSNPAPATKSVRSTRTPKTKGNA